MPMRLDRITPEITRGKGWAKVIFNDNFIESTFDSIAIVKPRHEKSFLGKHGWQISESRIPLIIEKSTSFQLSFLLPPSVVQYMEVSSNYQFNFFDKNSEKFESVIVRWSGISYRNPGGELSPIEVISISNHPESITKQDLQGTSSISGTGWPFSSTPKIEKTPDFGWHIPKESPTKLVEDPYAQVQVPSIDTPSKLIETPNLPNSPKEVKKIKCRNSKCNAEILDSMQICPFCNFGT
jgi:hypothetical protein